MTISTRDGGFLLYTQLLLQNKRDKRKLCDNLIIIVYTSHL
jgi:hypothetical protein